jgi:hypothetical protein
LEGLTEFQPEIKILVLFTFKNPSDRKKIFILFPGIFSGSKAITGAE